MPMATTTEKHKSFLVLRNPAALCENVHFSNGNYAWGRRCEILNCIGKELQVCFFSKLVVLVQF